MGAQHRIHRLEHVAHALFRDRTFNDDDQLRLVGGSAHQPPAAVVHRDPHAVDGDEVADPRAGDFLAALFQVFEVLHHLIDHAIFGLVGAMR